MLQQAEIRAFLVFTILILAQLVFILLAHSNLDFRDLELGILIIIHFVILLLIVIVFVMAVHGVDIEVFFIPIKLVGFSPLVLVQISGDIDVLMAGGRTLRLWLVLKHFCSTRPVLLLVKAVTVLLKVELGLPSRLASQHLALTFIVSVSVFSRPGILFVRREILVLGHHSLHETADLAPGDYARCDYCRV